MAARASILIVEDDSLISAMLAGMLSSLDYEVLGQVTGGEEAVQAALRLGPDLILMDIELDDGVDGFEAACRINRLLPTPVVLLSAYDRPRLMERAAQAGVGAYLVKPPDERRLERAIAVTLARFRELQALSSQNRQLDQHNQRLERSLKEREDIIGELQEAGLKGM